jgi:hypothetical protein
MTIFFNTNACKISNSLVIKNTLYIYIYIYIGNASFQSLIESKYEEHSLSHQDEKAVITWWIVEQVENKGGNFLEWNSKGMWSQILDRAYIRHKVSSCFRTFRRKLNAMKHTQDNGCFTSEFMLQDGSKRKRAKDDEAFCDEYKCSIFNIWFNFAYCQNIFTRINRITTVIGGASVRTVVYQQNFPTLFIELGHRTKLGHDDTSAYATVTTLCKWD